MTPITVRPTLTGIHHIGITVTDVEASAAWYERVLGLGRLFQERHYHSEANGYTIVLGPPVRGERS
jgi:catechol 2,3-dioxygenase-like lactoylglutathione lyase family enzyme